jgi:hypothetical protein
MIADELRRRTHVFTDIVELRAKLRRDSIGDPLSPDHGRRNMVPDEFERKGRQSNLTGPQS